MFKQSLISVALLAGLASANMHIAAKAGYNYSNLDADFKSGSEFGGSWSGKASHGYNFALEAGFEFMPNMQVITGLGLESRGATLSSDRSAEADYSFRYVSVPVLFQYSYPVVENQKVYVGTGPKFFGLQSAKADISGSVDEQEDGNRLVSSNFYNFDFAWNARLGYLYNLNEKMGVSFDVGYSFGLVDIDDFSSKDEEYEGEKRRFKSGVQNRNLELNLGFQYNL